MNSSVHKTTGFLPSRLLFNNNVDLDRGAFLTLNAGMSRNVSYDQWVAEMAEFSQNILEVARNNLREHDEIHMITSPECPTEFAVNSYVLMEHRDGELRRGPKSKLYLFSKVR